MSQRIQLNGIGKTVLASTIEEILREEGVDETAHRFRTDTLSQLVIKGFELLAELDVQSRLITIAAADGLFEHQARSRERIAHFVRKSSGHLALGGFLLELEHLRLGFSQLAIGLL